MAASSVVVFLRDKNRQKLAAMGRSYESRNWDGRGPFPSA